MNTEYQFYECRIFGPMKQKVVRGWKSLHNVKFHDLYSSPIIVTSSAFHVACIGNEKGTQNSEQETSREKTTSETELYRA
jgi:hypothetical protein